MYIIPTPSHFPDLFKGLSHTEIIVLRPFTVHLGDYVKKQNGYRQKTNIFKLTWSEHSVLEKIDGLVDQISKQGVC